MGKPSSKVKVGTTIIRPVPEFIEAFEQDTGLECMPANVIFCIRSTPAEFDRVRERHAAIVERKINSLFDPSRSQQADSGQVN